MNMALGASHSPLLGITLLGDERDALIDDGLTEARDAIAAFKPDLAVVFFPDHYHAFFYELMPQFCIGAAVSGIGDYRTHPGSFHVDTDAAIGLAGGLLESGFDVAVSYDMKADHGLAQAVERVLGGPEGIPVLPVFINCVAPPLSPCWRVSDFGRAVGRHFAGSGKRMLFVGSGGLSHDPPLPKITSVDAADRKRITERRMLLPHEREAREIRTKDFAVRFARGETELHPLNPEWDRRFMDRIAAEDWDAIRAMRDADITAEGGGSANEVRAWIAAFSALGRYRVEQDLYLPVKEWIVGYGLMRAVSESAA